MRCQLGRMPELAGRRRAVQRARPGAAAHDWQSFRAATLNGQPEQVARYYKFPVQLLPPMDGMKPMKITRPVFIKNYAELFQRGPADTEIAMLTAMKKTTGKEYIPQQQFDSSKCRYNVPTASKTTISSMIKKPGGWWNRCTTTTTIWNLPDHRSWIADEKICLLLSLLALNGANAASSPDVTKYLAQRGWTAYDNKARLAMPANDIAPLTYYAKGANVRVADYWPAPPARPSSSTSCRPSPENNIRTAPASTTWPRSSWPAKITSFSPTPTATPAMRATSNSSTSTKAKPATTSPTPSSTRQ
jgi:hypothetical protein